MCKISSDLLDAQEQGLTNEELNQVSGGMGALDYEPLMPGDDVLIDIELIYPVAGDAGSR